MVYIKIGNKKINNIKFAITQEEQEKGLMFSNWEPEITVFPYKTAEIRKFWMKNTPVPLDIIFCNAYRVIYIVTAKPFDKKLVGPKEKTDLVIETPGGFCAYNQIQKNDLIKIGYNYNILKKIMEFSI